jgi:hypothetical protein
MNCVIGLMVSIVCLIPATPVVQTIIVPLTPIGQSQCVGTHVTGSEHLFTADYLEGIKILGAALAFLIGLAQYRKSQKWKRVEFVASEMKVFFDDEAVKAATLMLDWSQKEIDLYKYRENEDNEKEWVTYALVAESLNTDPEAHYDKRQSAIREIFDRLLTFLERFESFIEAGVVEKKDLEPYLHYWIKMLAGKDDKSPLVSQQVLPHLWRFAVHFRYQKVLRFVERYERLTSELKTSAQQLA